MQICYNLISQSIFHMFRALRDHHQGVSFFKIQALSHPQDCYYRCVTTHVPHTRTNIILSVLYLYNSLPDDEPLRLVT
jgi:hypothetical protein